MTRNDLLVAAGMDREIILCEAISYPQWPLCEKRHKGGIKGDQHPGEQY